MGDKEASYLRGRETEPIFERPTPIPKIILTNHEVDVLGESSSELTRSASSVQTSIQSQASSTASSVPTETASVYLRIRPVESYAAVWKFRVENETFIAANIENVQTKNKNTVEQHYKFSRVFDEFAFQVDIYNNCMKPLISLYDSATVMVYGTSGSGKTHTLLGDVDNPGLVPRFLSQLFVEYSHNISTYPICKQQNGILSAVPDDEIHKDQRIKIDLLNSMPDSPQPYLQILENLKVENNFESQFIENCQLFLWVSFVEIYNENVYDLLACESAEENKENNQQSFNTQTKRKNLKVISNNGQPFVQGVSQIFVRNFEETIKILQFGMHRASTGSTGINERSSRSHCIFFVDLIKWKNNAITSTSYKFCDLAGSERLKKSENIGKRLKEANNINKSLMTLGRCLVMANERQKNKSAVIPYRDSKLTTLLQNALLGHEKISLIVNLNPELDYTEENLNVLNFASIAKEIVTKPKAQTVGNMKRISRYSLFMTSVANSRSAASVTDFHLQIENLLDRNFELEQQIQTLNQEKVEQEIILRKTIVESLEQDYQRTVKHYEKQISALKMNYKAQCDILKMYLEQKNKKLQRADKKIEKLKAQNKKLHELNEVYICDDSETESEDSDQSD